VRAHFACAEYRRLQEIFSPAELLKTMDVEMTGNYAASEAMRARERAALVALGETLGKHVMLLFPTKFALQETAKLVERVADGHKVSVTETSAGDGTYEAVGIATGAVLDVIGKQYGLLETGRSPADPRRIRGTQDGSNITKSDDFTMQGIHVNDSRAVDPITGKPITDFQSPDRVHITTLAVGHESHALYEALDDVTDHFSTAATAQTDGVYQSEAEGRAVHVDYVCSGDMANLQTVSKKGFATGTSENARPCYCCAQTNRQMTTPKVVDDLCDVCRAAGRLVCYHAEMSTPAAVDEWRATAAAALTELRGELPPAYRYMREAKTLSAAQLRELAAEAGLDAGGTSAHLHARFAAYCGQHCLELENPNQNGFYAKFDCRTATPAQKTQFSLVVNDCLVDFGLAVTGNLGSRVEKLTQRLKLVDQYYELQAQLEHATPNSDALISLVEHMVPCVLHLENRTREKLLRLILNNLFVIYEKSVALAKLRPLEKLIRTKGFGCPNGREGKWTAPLSKDEDSVEKISLNCGRARKIFANVGTELIEACFPDDAKRRVVLDLVRGYEELMVLYRKREDLTDVEIAKADDLAQETYHRLLTAFTAKALTNYFHMIGSGHITAYLRKYRNLYRYSNQGFESVNHLIKRFFLTRTQRGGHCGHEATRATRVAALGKWMQRRMMWLTGLVKPGELKVIGWKQKRVIDW